MKISGTRQAGGIDYNVRTAGQVRRQRRVESAANVKIREARLTRFSIERKRCGRLKRSGPMGSKEVIAIPVGPQRSGPGVSSPNRTRRWARPRGSCV